MSLSLSHTLSPSLSRALGWKGDIKVTMGRDNRGKSDDDTNRYWSHYGTHGDLCLPFAHSVTLPSAGSRARFRVLARAHEPARACPHVPCPPTRPPPCSVSAQRPAGVPPSINLSPPRPTVSPFLFPPHSSHLPFYPPSSAQTHSLVTPPPPPPSPPPSPGPALTSS